ncbi:hypothetical protein [Algicola sagamiensis]|uniref:hypothetical protein n=1 Tax=Algicola sagamiensis TaxID=163869 RepID=UPI00035E59DA|nr:hypothetical protein [Algicola sagamiensis]
MASALTEQYYATKSKIKAARAANMMEMKSAALDAIDASTELIYMLVEEVEALKEEIKGNA